MRAHPRSTALLILVLASAQSSAQSPALAAKSSAEILAASTASDWRALDPDDTLYLDLTAGRVVIELAPQFAPRHVANVEALAREGYYDGLAILRAQDNYVVQWGDPDAEDEAKRRSVAHAERTLPAELFRRIDTTLPFTALPDGDVYAPEVGFSAGFPAARDPSSATTWLAHCYGMLGAGRGDAVDSGGGTELYVVIGHSPRHLDRNVTLFGRVIHGMSLLSTLPRGSGALGFYQRREQHVPIVALRVAADVPASERTELELLRTDTSTWGAYVESRRTRSESWFVEPVGRIELCNVLPPVRERGATR
jgi:peptidylprolyl isomerase